MSYAASEVLYGHKGEETASLAVAGLRRRHRFARNEAGVEVLITTDSNGLPVNRLTGRVIGPPRDFAPPDPSKPNRPEGDLAAIDMALKDNLVFRAKEIGEKVAAAHAELNVTVPDSPRGLPQLEFAGAHS